MPMPSPTASSAFVAPVNGPGFGHLGVKHLAGERVGRAWGPLRPPAAGSVAKRGRVDLIPVVQRSYDLWADLYEHVNRFPRAQRTLLGRLILDDAAPDAHGAPWEPVSKTSFGWDQAREK